MILLQIFGLIFNINIVYLLIAKKKDSNVIETIIKILKLILILLFIVNIYLIKNFQGINISILDGVLLINTKKLILENIIILFAFLILNYQSTFHNSFSILFLLFFTNLIGISSIIKSNDWLLTIISWELINLSLYLIISINSNNESALSASLKYFILSALSTTFLLLGVLIIYKNIGNTNYDYILISLNYKTDMRKIELGYLLILFTIFFKLSAAPLHQWAPDLYDNLDLNISMWLMIIPKFGILYFLYLIYPQLIIFINLNDYILIFGIISLLLGSIVLHHQWRIIRFLAYSSISHIGYLLLAYYNLDYSSYLLYIIIYGITTINILSIILIKSQLFNNNIKFIHQLTNLFKINPYLGYAFSLNLFSLAGVCLFIIFFNTSNYSSTISRLAL